MQEAFTIAAARWPQTGMPDNPGAWLVTTARNRAIDRIRREKTFAEKLSLLAEPEAGVDDADITAIVEPTAVKDERLELIFTCCHPALPLDGQVALTLRALGGLQTADIARAFLVSEETMKRRLSRAKNKIKATGIPFAVPAAHTLGDRLDAVLAVLYLIFNSGYSSGRPSAGDSSDNGSDNRADRRRRADGGNDLAAEAIRLAAVLAELMPDEPEALGLLALMTIHHARRDARFRGDELILLADQDRTVWHMDEIARGRHLVSRALRLDGRGPYLVQAAIAALQTEVPIDWSQVARLYQRLVQLTGSAVVELNYAVAVAESGDPGAALSIVDDLDLDSYLYYHSTRGEFLRRLGREVEARDAYTCALALATTAPERGFLTKRIAEIDRPAVP